LKFVDFPFVIGADGTQCITPTTGIDARFLYYALQSLDLRGEGYARHFKLLKEKTIPVPDLREQREIAAQLLALETSISAAAQSTQRLVTVKQSLMSDLLSGRVRVPA
jgi:type I restriction enzyme S subunit